MHREELKHVAFLCESPKVNFLNSYCDVTDTSQITKQRPADHQQDASFQEISRIKEI